MAKKLSTRLAALEAASNTGDLTAVESALLVTILARRDAMFWPWRFQIHSKTPFTELRLRQREYLSGAAGVTVKADGKDNWKDAHAMRQSLIAAGMITATHSGGQVQSVFLTATGEAVARGLVGSRLHSFHESGVLVLARLRQLSAATSVRAVRESVLWNRDCSGCPDDWNGLTELILPCLTCGIVEASSDAEGRACYTPIDSIPEPGEINVDVQAVDEMDSLYVRTCNNERTVLETLEARDPHEVFVPMPATGWGWPCYFPQEETT